MEKIENWCRELTPHQTDKKLIVLSNKCIPAGADRPFQVLDSNSKIGIMLQDYSQGKGDKNIKVTCNINIGQLKYLYERSKLGVDMQFPEDIKIFGDPLKEGEFKGKCPCTKLTISRQSRDKEGKAKTYPWYISVENGYGSKSVRENGSTFLVSGSYKKNKSVYFNMSDLDFFSMVEEANQSIDMFCMAVCLKQVKEGYDYYRNMQEEFEKNRNSSGTSQNKDSNSDEENKTGASSPASNSTTNTTDTKTDANSSVPNNSATDHATSSAAGIVTKTFDVLGTMEPLETQSPQWIGTYTLSVMEGNVPQTVVFVPDVIKKLGKEFDNIKFNIDNGRYKILSWKVQEKKGKYYYCA